MKKVIIIEDSPTFCNMLGKKLEAKGWKTRIEGLQMWKPESYKDGKMQSAGSEGMENNLMLQLQRWSESCEGIL